MHGLHGAPARASSKRLAVAHRLSMCVCVCVILPGGRKEKNSITHYLERGCLSTVLSSPVLPKQFKVSGCDVECVAGR